MSTELATVHHEIVDVFDEPVDSLKEEIDSLLSSIRNQELHLATSHARLGCKLLRVQKEKRWADWGFESFGKYVDAVRVFIDRGRASIYAYVSVAEKLLPSVSESDIDRMGISRAQELARFVKQSGRKVTSNLLELALDDTKSISELHAKVLEELHERGEVRGDWFDPLGGGFYTAEEKQEIRQAVDLATQMAEFGADVPDHSRRKEIALMWAREFVSSNPIE